MPRVKQFNENEVLEKGNASFLEKGVLRYFYSRFG